MDAIAENLKRVQERIASAAHRVGRAPEEIKLVGVTKTVEPQRINAAIKAGLTAIGENRIQEAREKYPQVLPVEWHMVGHLQTNKVKYAVKMFDMIQSVDSVHLAEEINNRCEGLNKPMPVLIEVNTSGEESKYGCKPSETIELVSKIKDLPFLSIRGLMTIGLFSDDPGEVRPCFQKLRELAEQIKALQMPEVRMDILSMGMSADFEWAIEEGSNMVRIGTAIFGERPN
ncbi:MAG: YggS family pyridoxal phosphate-dependent enzyme [Calditrichia bacterium]